MSSIAIQSRPYQLAILHAAKYPSQPILGILLGNTTKNSSTTTNQLDITGALPLFHCHPVGPMLEIAMLQGECIARDQQQQIVGIYVAHPLYDKKEVSAIANRLANKIAEYLHNAVILILDNTKIAHSKIPPDQAFDVLSHTNDKWIHAITTIATNQTDKENNKSTTAITTSTTSATTSLSLTTKSSSSSAPSFIVDSSTLSDTRVALHNHRQRSIVDFEDHLEDVTADWLNASIS